MESFRYRQVKEIVATLLSLDSKARKVQLSKLCLDDDELRREVESLLQSSVEAHEFLDKPSCSELETVRAPASAAYIADGGRIGPYRVLREIGSGGMGIVYEAVREDEIRKKVALKLVKPGMDTELILRRFQSERRISAALNHPNITMLLDGGASDDGRPYFAMEYVEGSPIDVYCQARTLPLRQRLELFRTICGAVHYAHQNLIVHRDLKPSNIFITKDGVPKLLDFGIAKILSPFESSTTAAFTAAMPMMTPDYASPEQARGESVTTATDVYSLGAVLYELLTSKRPHRFTTNTPQQMLQVICLQEPIVPSEAGGGRELRGDLDNIVLKAMHKEPMRRYSSAEELSQDIERFLSGMPVSARKDTITYRVGKFVRRHQAGVVAASLVVLALSGGIITTAWQARIAARERDRAEKRFADVRKLANAVLWDLSEKLPNLAGNRDFRRELLQTGVRYLDTLSKESGRDSSLDFEIARGYSSAANALRTSASGLAPDLAGAADSYTKAITFTQRISPSDREWDEAQDVQITASAALGGIKKDGQRLQDALALARTRYDQDKSNVDRAKVLAAVERASAKNPVEGLRNALTVAEGTYTFKPNDPKAQRLYFEWAAKSVAALLFLTPDGAWKVFEPAEQIGRNLVSANPSDHATAYAFANALSAASRSRASVGGADLEPARKQVLESIAIFNKFIPNDPTDYDYRAYSAMARMGLSYIETRSGNYASGVAAVLEGLEIMKPFAGTRFESPSYRLAMGGLHVHAARAHQLARQMQQACSHYREADRFYGRPKDTSGPFINELLGLAADGRAVCGIP